MKFGKTGLAAILTVSGIFLSAAPTTNDAYAVCAHMHRDNELPVASRQFSFMRNAGINWIRDDFSWGNLEFPQGKWHFGGYDKLVEAAKENGINILPILDYSVRWATPSWKHLDQWGNYVRTVVKRYGKQLRYWEVYNEQNSPHFWRDAPSGKNYTALLKRSCEEIKRIDPELKVLYGGTAGVPIDFIEQSFAAGAGNYFDIMNIHPYQSPGNPELMIPHIRHLKALMRKYKISKPVWITEIGWPTAEEPAIFREILPHVFKKAGLVRGEGTAALVFDPREGFSGALPFESFRCLNYFKSVKTITLAQIKDLNVKDVPLLIPCVWESFPAEFIPDLVRYTARGGTLLLPSGLPFYYEFRKDQYGKYCRKTVSSRGGADFHLGWEAWWTRKGVPKEEKYQKAGAEFQHLSLPKWKPSGRFMHDRNLKKGDRFIPVIEAGTEQYKGTVFALYKLNSDLKGNVIVNTSRVAGRTSEARQAEFLSRTYIVALSCGVERIFWYNFRAMEWDKEDPEAHFGIIRKNLSPKPAYQALRTLAELCPSGSTVPELKQDGERYLAKWIRPDGKTIWAVWSVSQAKTEKLRIKGSVERVLTNLGENREIDRDKFIVSTSVTYLVGPDNIEIR